MKTSINLMKSQPGRPGRTMADLVATFRAVGMTDAQIKVELLKLLAKQDAQTPAPADKAVEP